MCRPGPLDTEKSLRSQQLLPIPGSLGRLRPRLGCQEGDLLPGLGQIDVQRLLNSIHDKRADVFWGIGVRMRKSSVRASHPPRPCQVPVRHAARTPSGGHRCPRPAPDRPFRCTPSSHWDGPCPRLVPAAHAECCLGLHQILQPPCVHHQGPDIRALDRLLDA